MRQTAERKVPVNLRQSGYADVDMLVSTRVRKSPYWHKSVEAGVRAVTVYNKMYHPRLYFSPEEGGLLGEYRYLTEHVTLWNVAAERQIQVKGPDALAFVDLVVTRAMTGSKELAPDKARYVILCDDNGGIVSDAVLLRLAEDEFWFSISDSDVLLWLRGLNHGLDYDVDIEELDVSPLQIQGPKSIDLMRDLLGASIDDLGYYNLWQTQLADCQLIVSRTGFSGELGYEIYLRDATEKADQLWDQILKVGGPYNLRVVAPGHIRRIEAGILSYGQDMDIETNPYEVGLDWQVDLDKEQFLGKEALERIAKQGWSRQLVGLTFAGPPVEWYNADFWPVALPDGEEIGYITSAFTSPKMGCNIALAMLPKAHTALGTSLQVFLPNVVEPIPAEVHQVPFFDPAKEIAHAKVKAAS